MFTDARGDHGAFAIAFLIGAPLGGFYGLRLHLEITKPIVIFFCLLLGLVASMIVFLMIELTRGVILIISPILVSLFVLGGYYASNYFFKKDTHAS